MGEPVTPRGDDAGAAPTSLCATAAGKLVPFWRQLGSFHGLGVENALIRSFFDQLGGGGRFAGTPIPTYKTPPCLKKISDLYYFLDSSAVELFMG